MTMGQASLKNTPIPQRGKKYFTLAQANRSLCLVGRVVEDIHHRYQQAMEIRKRAERPVPGDDQEQLRDGYEKCMDRLNELMDELHQVGVEFKDFDLGLVDYPAVHEGREVYLSWKRGEKCITAWHEADTGYGGRQDVAVLDAVGE